MNELIYDRSSVAGAHDAARNRTDLQNITDDNFSLKFHPQNTVLGMNPNSILWTRKKVMSLWRVALWKGKNGLLEVTGERCLNN